MFRKRTSDGVKQEQTTAFVAKGGSHLVRVARGQLYAAPEQFEKERGYLKKWRYGEMIKSPDGLEVARLVSAKKLDDPK